MTTNMMLQFLKTSLGRYKTALLRQLLPNYRRQRGAVEERQHWSRLFSAKDTLFADPDFKNRANPNRQLEPVLAALLPHGKAAPEILDVGCGPLSTVGVVFANGRVNLSGADPLADDYRMMLERIGVEPNCRLAACRGEDLVSTFGSETFDLVTSINALDHSESPKAAFDQMVQVCKAGGHIYLFHAENEGLHQRYRGMHQWNFCQRNNKPIINDGRYSIELLAGLPQVELVAMRKITGYEVTYLEWVFRKKVFEQPTA
jgi:SAM-dependent methyltransferase